MAVGILAVALLSAEGVRQVGVLARDHVKLEAEGRQRLAAADDWLASRGMHLNLEDTLNHPPPNVRSWGEAAAHSSLKVVEEAGKSALESIIVMLISVYFLIYCTEMKEGFNRALPERLQPYAEQWESDVAIRVEQLQVGGERASAFGVLELREEVRVPSLQSKLLAHTRLLLVILGEEESSSESASESLPAVVDVIFGGADDVREEYGM